MATKKAKATKKKATVKADLTIKTPPPPLTEKHVYVTGSDNLDYTLSDNVCYNRYDSLDDLVKAVEAGDDHATTGENIVWEICFRRVGRVKMDVVFDEEKIEHVYDLESLKEWA